LVVVAASVVLLAAILIVLIPEILVPDQRFPSLEAITETKARPALEHEQLRLQNDRLKLRNDARASLLQSILQGLGGLAVALGVVVTWRQLQHNISYTREQHALAREGQITERFTTAINQIGDDKIDVRMGGIYALDRIARESTTDRPPIAEVLSAYVRGHSPWPPSQQHQPRIDASITDLPRLQAQTPDVQAAMTVLASGNYQKDGQWLRLRDVDLRRANLSAAKLKRADFEGSNLERAWLRGANLEYASFYKADLEAADLQEACMKDVSFFGATLKNANLKDADLEGADLRGADLDGADLIGALMNRARADSSTQWPSGFEPPPSEDSASR
jgi:hypothetical protein